jgi:hypothetical protein
LYIDTSPAMPTTVTQLESGSLTLVSQAEFTNRDDPVVPRHCGNIA